MANKLLSPKDARKNFLANGYSNKKAKLDAQKIWDEKYTLSNKFKPKEKFYTTKPFAAGKVYTFDYNPISKDSLAFYDRKPIILALGGVTKERGWLEYGLNLSFIPEDYREFIVDSIFKVGHRNIGKDYKSIIKTGKSNIKSLGLTRPQVQKLLKGTGYEFAFRSYYKHRMYGDVKAVFYDDWYLLKWVQSKSVRKKSLGDIRKMYMQNKAKNKAKK